METADLMNAPESELLHRIATLECENERMRAQLDALRAPAERSAGWWQAHRMFCSGIGCARCADRSVAA